MSGMSEIIIVVTSIKIILIATFSLYKNWIIIIKKKKQVKSSVLNRLDVIVDTCTVNNEWSDSKQCDGATKLRVPFGLSVVDLYKM